MLMADRTEQRPEPHLSVVASSTLDAPKPAAVDDELLAGSEPEDPEAADASTAKDKIEEPEPLPPADPVSDREMETFLRQLCSSRTLERVVRGLVRDADVEDVVQEGLMAVRRSKSLPNDEKRRLQYARAIARNKAVVWYRLKEKKRTGEVEYHDLSGEAVEDSGLEGVLHGEQLEKIVETVPVKHRSTFECLTRHLMGESIAEMAREMNVEYDTLYKRVTTLHRHVKEAGKALGGLAMLLVVLAGAWRVLEPPSEVAAPAPSSWTTPTEAPAPRSPEALQKARELRDQAFRACTQDDWTACERALDEARDLDPHGEADPRVQAARADVHAAAEHGAGTGWSPKRPRLY